MWIGYFVLNLGFLHVHTLVSLPQALNRHLPSSLRIISAIQVPPDFHPLADVLRKTYQYTIDTSPIQNPLLRRTRAHYPWPIDMRRLHDVAELMSGRELNFAPFSSRKTHAKREGRVQTRLVDRIHWEQIDSDGLIVSITSKGFLYHQVRHMVGAMLECAQGRVELEELENLLLEDPEQTPADRLPRWALVPPEGLCLHEIEWAELPRMDLERIERWLMHPELAHDEKGRLK